MPRVPDTRVRRNLTIFDTASFKDGRNYFGAFREYGHVGNHELTNMDVPGQLACDSTFRTQSVLFGGPIGVLKDWANIQWSYNIGMARNFEGVLWMPPDAVEHSSLDFDPIRPDDRAGWVEPGPPEIGKPVYVKTPLDWEFLVFTPREPLYVAARQSIEVGLACLSGTPPKGTIRVALRGVVTMDLL